MQHSLSSPIQWQKIRFYLQIHQQDRPKIIVILWRKKIICNFRRLLHHRRRRQTLRIHWWDCLCHLLQVVFLPCRLLISWTISNTVLLWQNNANWYCSCCCWYYSSNREISTKRKKKGKIENRLISRGVSFYVCFCVLMMILKARPFWEMECLLFAFFLKKKFFF